MTPLSVELIGVDKAYPPPTAVTALQSVSVAVAPGETVAVTGPSGSGKSTMLNVLGTLEHPTAGTVRIAGTDTSRLTDAALSGLRAWQIGFVFQQFHLLEHLDVLENVATGLLYRGTPAEDRRGAAARALERVGLRDRLQHRPYQLSGGERQRVAIARAVVGEPALLLADEPTGNLDTATSAGIIALLTRLATPRTTVVVVTHDPGIAAAMRREIRLQDGRVVADLVRAP